MLYATRDHLRAVIFHRGFSKDSPFSTGSAIFGSASGEEIPLVEPISGDLYSEKNLETMEGDGRAWRTRLAVGSAAEYLRCEVLCLARTALTCHAIAYVAAAGDGNNTGLIGTSFSVDGASATGRGTKNEGPLVFVFANRDKLEAFVAKVQAALLDGVCLDQFLHQMRTVIHLEMRDLSQHLLRTFSKARNETRGAMEGTVSAEPAS